MYYFINMNNLYSSIRRVFPRRSVVADGVNDTWACDLLDMSRQTSRDTGGYVLVCVDIFSRKMEASKMPNKKADSLKKAFNDVFTLFGAKPKKIWFDLEPGLQPLKPWLDVMNITLYHTSNSYYSTGSHSNPIAERMNRTLRTAIMNEKSNNPRQNMNTIVSKVVKKFPSEYNQKKHNTTGYVPNEVFNGSAKIIRRAHREQSNRATEPRDEMNPLKLGQKVYLQRPVSTIGSKYNKKYYDEVYVVKAINFTNPLTYLLTNEQNEAVEGSYYREQLMLKK